MKNEPNNLWRRNQAVARLRHLPLVTQERIFQELCSLWGVGHEHEAAERANELIEELKQAGVLQAPDAQDRAAVNMEALDAWALLPMEKHPTTVVEAAGAAAGKSTVR